MTKRIDDLIQSICGTFDHPLAPLLRRWCTESRLFLDFAETYTPKIRKKTRLALNDDELADLLSELAVAAVLVRDRRFSVNYEPYRATALRAPDFQVLLKTHIPFHVEVTRLRLPGAASEGQASAALKLARVVGDKIGQFPAGVMNLLAVVLPPAVAGDTLVPEALRLLESATQREPDARSLEIWRDDAAAYLRQRQRLSAIALCAFTPTWHPLRITLWRNPQAKHPLHPEVARYLVQVPDTPAGKP